MNLTKNLQTSSFFLLKIHCAGWRRSHRPSLYDISIIDETEEREDPELSGDIETETNTNTNASTTPNALRAVFTINK